MATKNLEDDKNKDIFTFSTGKGVNLNVEELDEKQGEEKFEVTNSNPQIKNIKTNHSAEVDHYLEDPTDVSLQNEVLNNVIFSDGKMCLKKEAIEIIHSCFRIFSTRDREIA